MPPDTQLATLVRRVCAERGINPADALPPRTIARRDFYAGQLTERIHTQWGGRYDEAEPSPHVAAWVDAHLADPRSHPALFLAGTTGTGKTHNAVAAIRAIVTARLDRPVRWLAISHPELTDLLRPKSDGSHESALDPYLDVDLLLLDDLGAAMTTPWTTDCIQRLVDRRWTHSLTTIYTTNLTPEALRASVADRVFSRLGDATRINLGATDRRWQR